MLQMSMSEKMTSLKAVALSRQALGQAYCQQVLKHVILHDKASAVRCCSREKLRVNQTFALADATLQRGQ